MFTALLIGGILLIVALLVFAFWCVYRAGRDDGYEQALGDQAERVAERRNAGRHAKTQPRTSLVQTPEPEPDYEPITWIGEGIGQPRRGMAPSHVAASGIAPVILPEPGSYLPQAGRDSGDGTETFAKVELPATTGEMKAITDQWIAERAIEEEQFRMTLGK